MTMDFNTATHKLVAKVCNYCREHFLLPPGQVRATKLIYLIEWEYYSWEQKTFTDLRWIYYHYGPWSPDLSEILKKDFKAPEEQEIEPGKFCPVSWKAPSYEKVNLKFGIHEDAIVERVLERFAKLPYNELLDFVYFETEPMLNATKGQALDFSLINKRRLFVDPVSRLKKNAFNQLVEKSKQIDLGASDEGFRITLGREKEELMSIYDDSSEVYLPEGEIVIE